MVEALLALEGCRCISLGTQTPVWDIVLAASAQEIDIVALSFSPVMNPNQVVDGLTELRAKLPRSIEIWAGGRCPVLQRRPRQTSGWSRSCPISPAALPIGATGLPAKPQFS